MRKSRKQTMIAMMAIALTAVLTLPVTAMAGDAVESKNKKIVREFYDLAFNKRKPREAAEKYIGKRYVQHNPNLGDGRDAFIAHLEAYFTKYPEAHVLVKQVLADDDLVALHVHSKNSLDDRGVALVGIYRVEKGKIIEHWDVMQPIPENAKNENTMF